MSSLSPAFERLKSKGLAAYRNGEYAAAKPYLLQAAETLIEQAEKSSNANVRREREAIARELMELAKSCDAQTTQTKPRRAKADDEESGADASDWVVRERPTIRFDDIAGLDDVKHEIRLKMIYPFSHPELAKNYGIAGGGGLLLYGPPGTGKTMIAKAIACEVDATMFVISPAQIMSKWVGEAEQNIRKLFEAAKAEARAAIFVDEIEALVPRRRESSGSSVMTRVVPQILQELEGFDRGTDRPLLFVGATNEPWSLDPAVLRPGRFDSKVYVPLPDEPARVRLLEIYLGKRPLGDDLNFAELARVLTGYSGADIKAIAARAATIPFMESIGGQSPRPIVFSDVEAAIREVLPSVKQADLAKYERYAEVN